MNQQLLSVARDLADPSRSITANLVIVEFGGEQWTAGTNGHAMLLVAGAAEGVAPNDDAGKKIVDVLTRRAGVPTHTLDADALRAFLGVTDCRKCDGGREACAECQGTGEATCVCYRCGHEHDGGCEACDGDGTVRCAGCYGSDDRRIQPIVIGATLVNRRLLAPIARALPSGPMTWRDGVEGEHHTEHAPAVARGDGWLLLIMPLRDISRRDSEVPVLPLAPLPVAVGA